MAEKTCLFLAAVIILLTAGCTKERVYEGLYEGMQNREELVRPADEPGGAPAPSYQSYQRERDTVLKKDE